MQIVLATVVGCVVVVGAVFLAVKAFNTQYGGLRWTLSAVFFYAAMLAPIVIALTTPRLATTGAGFNAFDDTSVWGSRIISVISLLFLAGFAFMLVQVALQRWKIPGMVLALGGYAATGVFSAYFTGQPIGANLLYVFLPAACVLIASPLTPDQGLTLARNGLRVYIWGSLALALVAPGLAFWTGQGREWLGIPQLAGVTTHPNGLGSVAALAVFLELTRTGKDSFRKLNLVLALVVLAATESRGAWLGALIGVVVYAGVKSGRKWALLWILTGVGGLLSASTVIPRVAASLGSWSSGGEFSTLNGRTGLWTASLEAVSRSPVIGVGPSAFAPEYRAALLGLGPGVNFSNAHNQIIQTLVERGLLGGLMLVVIVATLIVAVMRTAPERRPAAGAIVAVYLSRFAVETPMNISTASINGAVLLVVVVALAGTQHRAPLEPRVTDPRREKVFWAAGHPRNSGYLVKNLHQVRVEGR